MSETSPAEKTDPFRLLQASPITATVLLHVKENRKIEPWPEDAVARVVGKERVKTFLSLPLHAQQAVYSISTHGHNYWEPQIMPGTIETQMFCPGSSQVVLSDDSGQMNMGWGPDNLVAPNGHFINGSNAPNSWPQPAAPNFLSYPPNGQINRYCMLVRIGSFILYNGAISSFGASVGDGLSWSIGANDGGDVYCGFNDEDDNNSGVFSQTISIAPISVMVWMHMNSLPPDLRKAALDLLPSLSKS